MKNKEVMVSVRMPSSLISKLKELSRQEDFIDLSEMVRSIVRVKWSEANKGQLPEAEQLGHKTRNEILKKCLEITQDRLLTELASLQKNLKKKAEQDEPKV